MEQEWVCVEAQGSWSRIAPRGLEQDQGAVRIREPYVAAALVARQLCIWRMRRYELRRVGSDCMVASEEMVGVGWLLVEVSPVWR